MTVDVWFESNLFENYVQKFKNKITDSNDE